jgi:TPR repeat protein
MAAQMYQNGGENLEVNGPLAVELYTLAAVKGDPRAAFNLGVAYCNGCGTVERDLDRAMAWWSKVRCRRMIFIKNHDPFYCM